LAFESKDDSEAEYERISGLLGLSFEELIDAVGVGESKARNAVKILPSIAGQVGDLHRESGRSYPTASIEIAEDSIEPISVKSKKKKSAPASGKRVTKEVVKKFAERMEGEGFRLFEDPFDCLATKDSTSLLIEVKTLDGSPSDERRQSEKALGQIKGYAHFDLPSEINPMDTVQIILFSQKPREATLEFLLASGIVPMWWNSHDSFELLNSDGDVVEFDPVAFG